MEEENVLEYKHELNPKQERFCYLYVHDKECFGNATRSYAAAYNIDITEDDNVVRATASTLLTKQNIKDRVRELLDALINDTVVDMELASVIRQNKELSSKVAAIREYNKLKARIVDRTDITSGGKTIEQIVGMSIIQDDSKLQNKDSQADTSK